MNEIESLYKFTKDWEEQKVRSNCPECMKDLCRICSRPENCLCANESRFHKINQLREALKDG